LTLEQVRAIEEGRAVTVTADRAKREVLNYFAGLRFIERHARKRPIAHDYILTLHRLIAGGVMDQGMAGRYRDVGVRVGRYVPPPAHEVSIMMSELVSWLNREQELHPVLVSGVAQFQLVHIHPFLDGNGRTSRLLCTLCLYRAGYDFKRLFALSEYYDRDRAAFYRALQDVRNRGMDLTGWLEYFVQGLTAQLAEVRERGEQALRRDALVKEHGLSDRQTQALDWLVERGSLTIQEFQGLCPQVNRRSLQRDLKEMVEAGLVVSEGATNQLVYRLKHSA